MTPRRVDNHCLPARVELVALDFDGVLTDNYVLVGADGAEFVRCSREDGMGIALLQAAGVPVVVLSSERHPVVAARCRKLGVECHASLIDKGQALRELLQQRKILSENVVFVGNDVNDIECLRLAGCGLVVADAHPAAVQVATAMLARPGGRGAVRELCDLLLARLGSAVTEALA